ncbi:MAG: sulfurtransferase [Pedobacter sp.]|nr:sulfurtransferase [Pedobacter sp.]
MKPILGANELAVLDRSKFILFDVSAGSKPRYDKEHLEGAFYMDLNTDLTNIDDYKNGGRHPLPVLEDFFKVLESFGVANQSHLILYDDKNGANAAARFWWMLRSIGHENVQVINGGYQAAVAAGFPISAAAEPAKPSKYLRNSNWQLTTANIDEVQAVAGGLKNVVIDVRDADRFAGLTEPIDLIAGHIPGAINVPFTENLDAEGLFLPAEVLKEKYATILGNVSSEATIVHCGSGVTACHTLLAMDYAGLEIPKLYVGSWSEWSRRGMPMILGE